jgi:hypothetical protein
VFHPLQALGEYRMDQAGNTAKMELRFGTRTETFSVPSRDAARMFEAIGQFDRNLHDAIVSGNGTYLRENDDLAPAERDGSAA